MPAKRERSGIYEMWFNRIDGAIDADRFAVNVDAQEGNLAQTPTRDIVANLDPVAVDIGYADQYETAAIEQAGFNQSLLLMCLLIVAAVRRTVAGLLHQLPSGVAGRRHVGRWVADRDTRAALAAGCRRLAWASAAVGRGWIASDDRR